MVDSSRALVSDGWHSSGRVALHRAQGNHVDGRTRIPEDSVNVSGTQSGWRKIVVRIESDASDVKHTVNRS